MTTILKRLEALEATQDTRTVLCELADYVRGLNARLTDEIALWSASKAKMASDRALLERQVAAIEKLFIKGAF